MQDRRPATTTVATAVAQCRRTDFGGGGGGGGGVDARRARATGQSVFYDDDADTTTMAASVAMLERFQQPATAVTAAAPGSVMAGADGDRSLRHRHYHNGYRAPHHATKYNSVSAGSALSKSMRYADGWLYERDAGGTVGHGRGGGVRNKARSTFLGREHFGMAAAAAAVTAAAAAAAVAANTAVPEDPYERVRKNRMAGATTAAAGKLDRKRNRSSSPRTPSPDYDEGSANPASSSRRSILECNVNPYDLLRQPDDDDDDVDDDKDDGCPRRLSLKDKFMNRIQDTVVFTKSKSPSVSGFGSFTSNGSAKKTAAADRTNSGVNIAGHTVSKTCNSPIMAIFLFTPFFQFSPFSCL